MTGLSKPQVQAKFEVAGFSRCRTIKGNPKILGSSSSPGPRPLFSGWDFMTDLKKSQLLANFEDAIFSRCRNIKRTLVSTVKILKGNLDILQSSPSSRPRPVFLIDVMYDGPCQPPAA